jgi:hypothetical protein
MTTDPLAAAAALTDEDLFHRLEHLANHEREATVELVAHLAALDTRSAYLGRGYGSLFAYCTDALRLSEDAAYSRILAARLARRFPLILERLGDGSVSLTTVRLLAAHLRPDNHRDVLAEATGKSKRQIEALVARMSPMPDVPTAVRMLPARPAVIPASVEATSAASSPSRLEARETLSGASPPSVLAPALARRPRIAPLAPERYLVQFTVGKDTYDKLQRVRDLLCREITDGDPAAIFDRALTLLLEDVQRKKVAATTRTRPPGRAAAGTRRVPAAVRRTVWRRDDGRCAFVAKDGRRCAEQRYLEFHHIRPFANGGEATVENISLRCRRHNAYEAELVFGRYDPSVGRKPQLPHGEQDGSPVTFRNLFWNKFALQASARRQ